MGQSFITVLSYKMDTGWRQVLFTEKQAKLRTGSGNSLMEGLSALVQAQGCKGAKQAVNLVWGSFLETKNYVFILEIMQWMIHWSLWRRFLEISMTNSLLFSLFPKKKYKYTYSLKKKFYAVQEKALQYNYSAMSSIYNISIVYNMSSVSNSLMFLLMTNMYVISTM